MRVAKFRGVTGMNTDYRLFYVLFYLLDACWINLKSFAHFAKPNSITILGVCLWRIISEQNTQLKGPPRGLANHSWMTMLMGRTNHISGRFGELSPCEELNKRHSTPYHRIDSIVSCFIWRYLRRPLLKAFYFVAFCGHGDEQFAKKHDAVFEGLKSLQK